MSQIVLVPGEEGLSSVLTPPVSKSDAQRALVLAWARGRLSDLALPPAEELPSDVRTLKRGLEALSTQTDAPVEISCDDGGAPFRFLLTQACLLPRAVVHLVGSQRLGERPHQPLLASLRAALEPLGLRLEAGTPWPIRVRGAVSPLQVHRFCVSGRESSQYASSLLLGCATVAARGGHPCVLELEGPLASAGYLEMTLRWVETMGFPVEAGGRRWAVLPPRQSFPTQLTVPSDWSSLGYLLLVAWKVGGSVGRVDLHAAHPDRALVTHLQRLGVQLVPGATGGVRVVGSAEGGLDVSAEECPDSILTLSALACVLKQPSRFRNVGILRFKESDRVAALEALVGAVGGEVVSVANADTLEVRPPERPRPIVLSSRNDHRLAMSAAVLAVLAGVPLTLEGPECVAKSFPAFWTQLQRAGVRVSSA